MDGDGEVATCGRFLFVVAVVVGRMRSHDGNLRCFARLRPSMVARPDAGSPARSFMTISMSLVDSECAMTSKNALVGDGKRVR